MESQRGKSGQVGQSAQGLDGKFSRGKLLKSGAKAGLGLTALGVLSADLAGTAEAATVRRKKPTIHTSIMKLGMPASATKLLTPAAQKMVVGDLFLISQGDMGVASWEKMHPTSAQLTAADVQSVQACLSAASYKAVLTEAKGTPYYQAIQSNVAAGSANPTGCISACTSTTCNVSCKNGTA